MGGNVMAVARSYMTQVVGAARGMKILLMDRATTATINSVYTHKNILDFEIFLVELLSSEGEREKMSHLKCVALVTPSPANVKLLAKELKSPKYREYHIFFTGSVKSVDVEALAEADVHEVVREVREVYTGWIPVTPNLASLDVPALSALYASNFSRPVMDATTAGLTGLCLAMGASDPVFRYQENSSICKRIASTVSDSLATRASVEAAAGNASGRGSNGGLPPVVVVMDRSADPVTPLLSQWTYTAMLHELIGFRMNTVTTTTKGKRETHVLAMGDDDFYRNNYLQDYGTLAESVKSLMEKYQSQRSMNENISSISDMKRFIASYGDFSRLSTDTSKHVSLLGAAADVIASRDLFTVSEVEQSLACTEDHPAALASIRDLFATTSASAEDRLRTVMLYALRYEQNSSSRKSELVAELELGGEPCSEKVRAVEAVLAYGGNSQRPVDLFENASLFQRMKTSARTSLKDVENIFTQHNPLIAKLTDDFEKGAAYLARSFPVIGGGAARSGWATPSPTPRASATQNVIVFVVGGVTFEEEACVARINATTPGLHMVLAGSEVLNSDRFIKELLKLPLPGLY